MSRVRYRTGCYLPDTVKIPAGGKDDGSVEKWIPSKANSRYNLARELGNGGNKVERIKARQYLETVERQLGAFFKSRPRTSERGMKKAKEVAVGTTGEKKGNDA